MGSVWTFLQTISLALTSMTEFVFSYWGPVHRGAVAVGCWSGGDESLGSKKCGTVSGSCCTHGLASSFYPVNSMHFNIVQTEDTSLLVLSQPLYFSSPPPPPPPPPRATLSSCFSTLHWAHFFETLFTHTHLHLTWQGCGNSRQNVVNDKTPFPTSVVYATHVVCGKPMPICWRLQ